MIETPKRRVERILQKLELVREQGLECFGSDSHFFQLNTPLEEKALQKFESQQRIQLPEDYRAFLRYAGNGGAGPCYGIYPLEKWNHFVEWVCEEPLQDDLTLSCPLYLEMERTPDWENNFQTTYPYQGTISIGTQGCTYEILLIVTGPFRGRVVYADADGQAPYLIQEVDFLAWYERWLDELLAGYKMDGFGYGVGGTEEDFLAMVNNPDATTSDRVEAVQAFWKLPKLSAYAQQQIQTWLSDPVDEIRASACRLIRDFELHDAEEAMATLLLDSSSEVRQEAIMTLMQIAPARWSEKIFQYLYDDDDEVAHKAFNALNTEGALTRSHLLDLINMSPNGQIQYLAMHTIEWKEEDQDLLIKLLDHKHNMVRFYATLGLRQIQARDAIAKVIEVLEDETDENVIGSILKMLGELGGEQGRDVLLLWAVKEDDYFRLDAVDALCSLGDERVAPIAKKMLQETKPPIRVDSNGFTTMMQFHSISHLVDRSLRSSPSKVLQKLSSTRSR
ncbi:HEAT repeat domain-containing protein [uncultured Gimesia sp.]|uniref:HEAT repeat domain-containing protein n=1 Tax=uncultured Gimesia sp. TaxID=1678688 RepID=UPI0030DD07F7|tara:strand:+ start:14136 stop:15653 length:1518 start_codon:yes stop_codon:yes gene_type:complete